MENIERTHFLVLTGHLDDQPLPDLIRTLRVQRKSGRLQVEYADSPGAFFFADGQLVDAQLGALRGLEALYAALELQGAAFNFNPLVRPPERSIDRQQQKFIADMVETSRRDNLAEIKIAGGAYHAPAAIANSAPPAPLQLAPVPAELMPPLEERLTAVEAAINATSHRFSRERLIYGLIISFLIGLTMITALPALLDTPKPPANGEAARAASAVPIKQEGEGVAASVEREGSAAAVSQATGATKNASQATTSQTAPAKSTQTVAVRDARKTAGAVTPAARGAYFVRVLMEVKDGQVTGARVLNPRSGAGDYESLALRMARQRRYAKNFTGGDTWNITVKP